MENQKDTMEKIVKRLDLIIRLMLKNQELQGNNKIAIKDQVLELYTFGISTQDIADLLGKTRNSIDIHLTTLRKEGKIAQKQNSKSNDVGSQTPELKQQSDENIKGDNNG